MIEPWEDRQPFIRGNSRASQVQLISLRTRTCMFVWFVMVELCVNESVLAYRDVLMLTDETSRHHRTTVLSERGRRRETHNTSEGGDTRSLGSTAEQGLF